MVEKVGKMTTHDARNDKPTVEEFEKVLCRLQPDPDLDRSDTEWLREAYKRMVEDRDGWRAEAERLARELEGGDA